VSELWGGRRVPVTLLGGYLGSGKTTLLNQLLANADRRYAVLVNDVGKVNVDAALVASRDGDTLELTDGCVCCSLIDGFALAFEQLRERPEPPDQVLVELSGVADPARVVPWTGTAGFALDGVVILFDLEQGLERESDRWSGDTVQRQIAAADLLVLTKRDLVDNAAERTVRNRLGELAPGTPVVLAGEDNFEFACLEPALEPVAPNASTQPDPTPPSGERSLEGHHRVASFRVPHGAPREELERWLLTLPDQVVRVKGILSSPSGLLTVQGVGHRRRVREASEALVDSSAVGTLIVISTAALDPSELEPPPGS
jgi:G3E family GTPase